MKRSPLQGQILPMSCVLLSMVILYMGIHGQETLYATQKIEQQSDIDLVAMQIANDQARALNAIAALNESLHIVSQRASIYAGTLLGLAGCASALLNPPCARAFLKLSAKAPEFFRKVNLLGKTIGDWQDALANWAAEMPEKNILYFNVMHLNRLSIASLDSFAGAPPAERLFIRRASAKTDEAGFSAGADRMECEKEIRLERSSLGGRPSGNMLPLGRRDKFRATYVSEGELRIETKYPPPLVFYVGGRAWHLDHLVIQKCRSFYDLLGTLDANFLPIQIPPPYVVEPDFPLRQKIALAIRNRKIDGSFSPLLGKERVENIYRLPTTVASRAKILGNDLQRMEFQPWLDDASSN